MSDTALPFITIDPRMYQFVRSVAIKNWFDALVELITNADDAYEKRDTKSDDGPTPRDIRVSLCGSSKLLVRDHALGMNSSEMKEKLLQVGKYTSERGLRGHFSRGAKDITALGDAHFEAIKDGMYSKCIITHEAKVSMVVEDIPATEAVRASMRVPANGFLVTLHIRPEHSPQEALSDIASLTGRITKIASLRDIFSNPLVNVELSIDDDDDRVVDIKYNYPSGHLVLDTVYAVPNYPDASARFQVYMADEMIAEPQYETQIEFGFLLISKKTIHQVTTFRPQFRHDRNMRHFYGRLTCDYIEDLLFDWEESEATAQNPFSIIDPARGGVNIDHPFIGHLFSVPAAKLDLILQEKEEAQTENFIVAEDVHELLTQLEVFGKQLLITDTIRTTWRSAKTEEFLMAVKDMNAQYVTAEINRTAIIQMSQVDREDVEREPALIYANNGDTGGEFLKVLDTGDLVPVANEDNLGDDDIRVFGESVPPEFKIEFADDGHTNYRFSITQTRRNIMLRVNLQDSVVAQYLTKDEVGLVLGLDSPASLILLGDMVTEGLSRLMTDGQFYYEKNPFEGMDAHQTLSQVFRMTENNAHSIAPTVHQTIEQFIKNMTD